jgi:hypothetical protein
MGLRERAQAARSPEVQQGGSVVASALPPSAAEPSVNVALREGEVLILGLTGEPLALTARTAERLARRLLDAVALAQGRHPGEAPG